MKKKFDLLSYEPQTKKDLSYLDKFFKIISENGSINIVKKNTNTAYYIPDTNTIVLPVFITEDKDLYIMFGSHEVSHAMHTPKDFYDIHNDSDRKVFKLKNGKVLTKKLMQCINIVEDIRIEKIIRRKFPGFVANYNRARFKLLNEHWTHMKNLTQDDWDKLNIADKINIKAKFGKHITYPLTQREFAIYKYCAKTETFNDVLVRALYLLKILEDAETEKLDKHNAGQDGELTQEDFDGQDGEKSDMEADESDLLDGDFDDLLESIDKESEDESEALNDEIQDKIKEMLDKLKDGKPSKSPNQKNDTNDYSDDLLDEVQDLADEITKDSPSDEFDMQSENESDDVKEEFIADENGQATGVLDFTRESLRNSTKIVTW